MMSATAIGLLLASAAALAGAAEQTAPRERLSLSASASVEVTRDVIGVTFSTTKEGAEAAAVQLALKQALDAALAEARKLAKPGAVDVRTGNFSLYPRYAPAKSGGAGVISGWQGSAELLVEGKDIAAIAQLSGRIGSMSIARVGYSLSREQREKVETEVVAQAISRYRARATDYSRQFGYAGYTIGEVGINTADDGPDRPVPMMMRAKPMAAAVDEALPVEAGKATVSVTVSGTIQMNK
jgi:predicted secreted protein